MIQTLVRQFHKTFGAPINAELTDRNLNTLRLNLIEEEYFELIDALLKTNPDRVEVADALGDLVYVIYGAAVAYGIDLDAVVKEIHRSNMSKLGEDGQPIYREDGKVLKGPNYSPPDLAPIVGAGVA